MKRSPLFGGLTSATGEVRPLAARLSLTGALLSPESVPSSPHPVVHASEPRTTADASHRTMGLSITCSQRGFGRLVTAEVSASAGPRRPAGAFDRRRSAAGRAGRPAEKVPYDYGRRYRYGDCLV